jgi:hypothetical protein
MSADADADAQAPERFELGARGFLAHGYGSGVYIFAGLHGLVRPFYHVGFGAYVDAALVSDPMTGDCQYSEYGCSRSAFRTGALARLDVLPTFIVDPWLAAAFGGFWVKGDRFDDGMTNGGLELEASVGVDLRLPYVSLGPYAFASVTSADGEAQVGTGLRAAVRF